MRIAVTGATGNVGTALLRALAERDEVREVVGFAKRATAELPSPRMRIVAADISRDDLTGHLDGVDALVHLAWGIHPMRDRARLRAVNVEGSAKVFAAAAAAGVRTVVHASSVGAYSPAAHAGQRIGETYPTGGIPTSPYSVDKAAVERLLDGFEAEHPDIRVARLRPALIFQREAAHEQVGYFAGGRPPGISRLIGRGLPPVLPLPPALRLQAVHADDVADAYVRAVLSPDARGAFNVGTDPVLGPKELGRVLHALPVPVPAAVVRALVATTFRLHLQPTEAGWFDLGMRSPLLDSSRIRDELGWRPVRAGDAVLAELLAGVRAGAQGPTPPLQDPSDG